MTYLQTGILATSHMEEEHRVPFHPGHFARIPEDLRPHLVFETGYGEPFGVDDAALSARFGGTASRQEILTGSDLVILVKPIEKDLRALKEGATFWGFVNCVQQRGNTQAAIDRRLTLIGYEAMHRWGRQGERELLVLAKNSEIAGYCAVLHAMHLANMDGHFGPPRKAALLGFGSANRGSIQALKGLGVHDLTVYTQRPPHLVRDQVPGCRYRQMLHLDPMRVVRADGTERPMIDALAEVDIIVNGSVQDPDHPLMYLQEGEVDCLRPGSLIIDVSCDRGMGFPFARSTNFAEPVFSAGQVTYYAVKNTPSYLWQCASWEISEALLPYLGAVASGEAGWEREETLKRATPIRRGEILNPKILSFQNRESEYPYPVRP